MGKGTAASAAPGHSLVGAGAKRRSAAKGYSKLASPKRKKAAKSKAAAAGSHVPAFAQRGEDEDEDSKEECSLILIIHLSLLPFGYERLTGQWPTRVFSNMCIECLTCSIADLI